MSPLSRSTRRPWRGSGGRASGPPLAGSSDLVGVVVGVVGVDARARCRRRSRRSRSACRCASKAASSRVRSSSVGRRPDGIEHGQRRLDRAVVVEPAGPLVLVVAQRSGRRPRPGAGAGGCSCWSRSRRGGGRSARAVQRLGRAGVELVGRDPGQRRTHLGRPGLVLVDEVVALHVGHLAGCRRARSEWQDCPSSLDSCHGRPRHPQPIRNVAVLAFAPLSVFEMAVACEVFGIDRSEQGRAEVRLQARRRRTRPADDHGQGFTIDTPYGLDDARRRRPRDPAGLGQGRTRLPTEAVLDALRRRLPPRRPDRVVLLGRVRPGGRRPARRPRGPRRTGCTPASWLASTR